MIKLILKRPVAVGMFYMAVVILGAFSFRNLSVEGNPDTELPELGVTASWGRTPPEVVQIYLTSPIEEAAAQIEGLQELESSSTSGRTEVSLRFARDTDMEFARLELNERMESLRDTLPEGATQPQIRNFIDSRDRTAFMRFDMSGPYGFQRLTEIYEDYIQPEISGVDGVADLVMRGDRQKALKIRLDRDAMDLYGLVPQQVFSKVNELTTIYETARTGIDNREYTLSIDNSIDSIQDIESLILRRTGDQTVRLRDVGTVEVGQAQLTSLSRLNGNPTLSITVNREVGASVIETSRGVKREMAELLERLPEGTRVDWISDEGEMMEEQLSSIYSRGFWCIVLIVFLLLIFLQSVSAAVVITLNILFSVVITVNFMYYFDVTFNVVTLSGLAIGFGMLVDNAIVVLENIFRHRELGHSRIDSAYLGVVEVGWALFAATLTTVASFAMMLFLEDRLAATYLPLALSVIFSLSASLLVSFTFTPLLSLMVRGSNLGGEPKNKKGFVAFIRKGLHRFTDGYGSIVGWCLRHKMLVCLGIGAVFFMYFRIFTEEIDKGGFSFGFGSDDKLQVYIRMPEGAELETADEVIRQFEAPLLDVSGYKDASVNVWSNFAHLQVTFDSDMLSSPYPLALKSKLVTVAQGFAGIGLTVAGISSDDNYYSGNTGYESYNSHIRIMGYNYKRLMDFSENLLRTVKRNRRVQDTNIQTSRSTFGAARKQTETALKVDRDALRRYDIDVSYIMSFISRNLELPSASRTKYQGEELVLEVKYEDVETFDIKQLEGLIVKTVEGKQIRLSDLVSLEERKVPGGIDRKDQQYSILVQWEYKGSPKKARRFNESVYSSLELPSGFKAELDYDRFLSNEEEANLLFVISLAVIVVFMIIAALYESFVDPLVIFATIPLSFIGVSWIYKWHAESFDSTAYIGLIILAGIVVNNSILLVSHINDEIHLMPKNGNTFNQALIQACKDRMRPILLTAITTIVGLLPLLEQFVSWFTGIGPVSWALKTFNIEIQTAAENVGLQSTLSMFSSLSRTTVGGMLVATLITLFIIPVVYSVFFRCKQWLNHRINEVFAISEKAEYRS